MAIKPLTLKDLDEVIGNIESLTVEIKMRPPQSGPIDVTSQVNRLKVVADTLHEIIGGPDDAAKNAKERNIRRKAKKVLNYIDKEFSDDDIDGDDEPGDTTAPPTGGETSAGDGA